METEVRFPPPPGIQRFRSVAMFLALVGVASYFAAAQPPVPAPTQAKVVSTAPRQISFPVPKTRLWLGQSQVIAFRANPARQKQVLPVSIDPPSAAQILQAPTILDGESIGYLRLRSLRPGLATLSIGKATLALQITADQADHATTHYDPEIISPMNGACLWGKISVGVELPATTPRSERTLVSLCLPGGRQLDPVASVSSGAHRHFAFDVDVDALPAGPAEFEAVAKTQDGRELKSAPLFAMVTRPDPSLMISGACADNLDEQQRPERFGEKLPIVVKDPHAPGGSYIQNSRPDPAWCLPVEIRDAGRYQMILTVRGTFAAGCFPSVGLLRDDEIHPAASVRLTENAWHRVPVGDPIRLEAGSHVLTARYLNDFSYSKAVDRNLSLDRYELVRVDGPQSPSAEGSTTTDDPMATAASGDSMEEMNSPAKSGGPLRVAFRDIFDGAHINGPVTVNALAWWPNHDTPAAPRVDLLVNGRDIQTQQGSELAFHVPVNAFQAGTNTVQLRAARAGSSPTLSTIQRILLPSGKVPPGPPSRFLRFTMLDDSWDDSIAQRLDKASSPAAAFLTNGESFLNLSDDLAGTFNLRLEARGQEYNGRPIVEILLRAPGGDAKSVAKVEIHNGWQTTDGTIIKLAPGPKQLVIRYVNDAFEKVDAVSKRPGGDRNLWLKALRLEETAPGKPVGGPTDLVVRYPMDRQIVGGADAVVVEAFSTSEPVLLDLAVDGCRQQLQARSANGLGPVLMPLLTRGLGPGPHTLQVLAANPGQASSESRPIQFFVNADPEDRSGPYQRAIYLLNRFAYGPEPSELSAILTLGEKEWLRQRLNATFQDPAEQAAAENFRAVYPDDRNAAQVIPRTVQYLLSTANPVRARFVLWTENHFSTWLQKDGALNKWQEHLQFAELGPAPFADLLRASASSPAMLVYLDQKSNSANHLNENYAREIMELHTLGVHGGYTQQDVTTLAHQLNGWTLSEEADLNGDNIDLERNFRFAPELNNGQARRILGMEFPSVPLNQRYDSMLSVLEMLAAHPSTAVFISTKLAQQYVSDPPPPRLVADLTKVFLSTGGDMRAMLTTIAEHPDFWNAQPRVATPLDFSLRFSRACASENTGAVADFLRKSGMGLFDRVSPDGYPEADNNYADSNSLLQRWLFAKRVQANLNTLIPASWVPPARLPLDSSAAQRLVDLAAVRLTGQPLSTASNEAAVKYLLEASQTDPDRVKLVTGFISQMPELSLR